MKKILSVFLAVVMLLGTMSVAVSAKGTLLFSDDFAKGFAPRNWLTDPDSCHFKWDSAEQCIYGYDSAAILQPNFAHKQEPKKWDRFYASYDVQIAGFDDVAGEEGRLHQIGLWYCDLFERGEDDGELRGCVYEFRIEIETGRCFIYKHHDTGWRYADENGAMQDINTFTNIAEVVVEDLNLQVGEDAPWYEIGMRVTDGKIEGYVDHRVVISAEANPEAVKYGEFTLDSVDETVGSEKSPVIFYNHGNYVKLDNFTVMTADYDFVDVNYCDADNNGKININDVTLVLKQIAKWDNLEINIANADADGNEKININDVTLILKVIAKWDVVPGPQA